MQKNKKKKKSKWIKPRHKFWRVFFNATLGTFSVLRYNTKIDRLPRSEYRQCLILYNHQSAFDQFFVGRSFPVPVYFLATEDIFSNGFSSKLIRYFVNPIAIKKQTTDVSAIMNCLRVVREGGTIAIAPEGNRTYSGKTEYMNPSIVTLIKQLKLPVAFVRLEGGYGVHPRWSDSIRRGKMHVYYSKIVEPDEIKSMTDDEIMEMVRTELYVNEANSLNRFTGNKKAEFIERAIYVCPHCGLAKFESHGNFFNCTKCDLTVEYTDTTELKAVKGDLPFTYVNDWYEYQQSYVNSLDINDYIDSPMFTDTAEMRLVIPEKRKELLKKSVNISLYGDRMQIDDTVWAFDETSAVVVLGKNKLNVYHGGNIYQFKGDKRFNALKYVNVFHRYKNIKAETPECTFLGL